MRWITILLLSLLIIVPIASAALEPQSRIVTQVIADPTGSCESATACGSCNICPTGQAETMCGSHRVTIRERVGSWEERRLFDPVTGISTQWRQYGWPFPAYCGAEIGFRYEMCTDCGTCTPTMHDVCDDLIDWTCDDKIQCDTTCSGSMRACSWNITSGTSGSSANCGDGTCDPYSEDCSSCSSDCGACPATPPPSLGYDLEVHQNAPNNSQSWTGIAPLNNMDGRHEVEWLSGCGTAASPVSDMCAVTFRVDCTNNGTIDSTTIRSNINDDTTAWGFDHYGWTSADVCDYPDIGTYWMRGIISVTRNGDGATTVFEDFAEITVTTPCGDGTIDTGEQCDGANLGGLTCADLGFANTAGLYCNPVGHIMQCRFNDSSCSLCGNNIHDPGETCEDGNTNSGDGCSSTCQAETIPCTVVPGVNFMRGCHYADMTLTNPHSLTQDTPVAPNPILTSAVIIDHDWQNQGPNALYDQWSGKWAGNFTFKPGNWQFTLGSDDGARLYFDDNWDGVPDSGYLIDSWVDRAFTTQSVTVNNLGGSHILVLEYYENSEAAAARLSMQLLSTSCGNGVAEPALNEECDGADVQGLSCTDLGHAGGSLSCTLACSFNISNCVVCGDGVIEAPEDCEMTIPNAQGEYTCWPGCTFAPITANVSSYIPNPGNQTKELNVTINASQPFASCLNVTLSGEACTWDGQWNADTTIENGGTTNFTCPIVQGCSHTIIVDINESAGCIDNGGDTQVVTYAPIRENTVLLCQNTIDDDCDGLTDSFDDECSAQFRGYIKDDQNNSLPASTVSVNVALKDLLQSTNAVGFFNIVGIPPGSYPVTVIKPGYQSQERTIEFTVREVVEQNFTLNNGSCSLCANWEGRCSVACSGAPQCGATVPPVCEGASPGEWRRFNSTEAVQCCTGNTRKPIINSSIELSGCMDDLVTHDRLVRYQGELVTLRVYTWMPCE